jgi:succinate dehydrogenase / fumarate reductase flavoprotein subunit
MAETLFAGNRTELAMVYRLRDMLLSQRAYLTAMIDYTANGGKSRGSALYTDLTGGVKPFAKLPDAFTFALDETEAPLIQELWFEAGTCRTAWRAPRPIPEDDDFFENVWRSYRETGNID